MRVTSSRSKRAGSVPRPHRIEFCVFPVAVAGRLGAVALVLACLLGSVTLGQQTQNVTLVPYITTVAGNGTAGFGGDGGPATSAELNIPYGVAVDRAGNLYIADSLNHRVRVVNTESTPIKVLGVTIPLGGIATVAGTGTPGFSGDTGQATLAELNEPFGVAVDTLGNLYIADYNNLRIRRVDTSGTITTVAGNGTHGYSGDGGAAINAALDLPYGLAVDRTGVLYISDYETSRVRAVNTGTIQISVLGVTIGAGNIATVAGNGTAGYSGDEITATSAELRNPWGVAVDYAGNLYIADSYNQRVRKVDTSGVIHTVAGNGMPGYNGDNIAATSAELNYPSALAVNSAGDIYIGDPYNYRIREVYAAGGFIATVAGNGTQGFTGDGGPASAAELNGTYGVAVDGAGNLYITELPQSIRKVVNGPVPFFNVPIGSSNSELVRLSFNTATTVASWQATGDYSTTPPQLDGSCGPSVTAGTMCEWAVYFTPSRPGPRWGSFVVTDGAGNKYSFGLEGTGVGSALAFTPGIISSVAGNGTASYGGDNGPATSPIVEFNFPRGVTIDSIGDLYIADYANNRVRKIDANGTITTVAGNGTPCSPGTNPCGDNGPAISAELYWPSGVAVDSAGNLYIADSASNRIRKVDVNGTITTVAGNGNKSYYGDGASATSAALNYPMAVAVDRAGTLYIADSMNYRIRRVDTNGIITTYAGNGTVGNTGDGGLATSAEFGSPSVVTLDSAGNLYIGDNDYGRVRKVSTENVITTIAGGGSGCSGQTDLLGDGCPAISAVLSRPSVLVVDSADSLYIADYDNYLIRKIDSIGIISTVAGGGSGCIGETDPLGDGCTATSAVLGTIAGLAVDSAGNLYIADYENSRIRKVNVTTSVLPFNSVNAGQTSSPQSVAVSDVGNASLNLTMIAGTGNFHPQTVGNDCLAGTPVGIGQTCNLGVVFAPTVPGNAAGTITLTDDAINSPQAINLSGSSTATPTFSNLTPSQTILHGTTPLTLSGTISAGLNFPPTNETVSVLISDSGHTHWLEGTATIGTNGNFSLGLYTSSLPDGTYTIAYSYVGDSNFTSASDNTTSLTVVDNLSSVNFPLTLTELGTGTGRVTDNSLPLAINCSESQGLEGDASICSANYPGGSIITLTATVTPPSVFAGWGGACASSGTSTTCSLTMNSALNVTANFVPQQLTPVTLQFDPGTSVTKQATFCPNDTSPCIAPNAHALTLGFAQVNAPFSLTVAATEYPADGLCPPDVTPGNDFDCRFVSFYNYGTDSSNPPNIIVPQCYPYANGNCVHYLVYYGTPGKEPDPSWYSGDVSWKVGFNNTTYTPSSYWAGGTPRMLDDMDTNEEPPVPYGTDCSSPMLVNGLPTSPPIYCQFVRDITTFYDPTPGLDPIGGKTKQNDVVVAFPPTTTGSGSQNQPQSPSAPGSISGSCVTGCMINGTNITFDVGTGGTFVITSTGGFPAPTLTLSGTLPSGLTFSSIAGWISGTPGAGTANTYPLTLSATNASGFVEQSYTLTVSNAAPLTITASSGTMTYGGTPPSVTPIYSGSLTKLPTCTTTATSTSPVGTYTSFCSGAVAANYVIAYQGGTVTVTPAPLVITASSATMTYGGTVPIITPNYSGFVNGDTASSLTTKPTCTTTATSTSLAGPYPSTCSGAVDPNYTISYVSGTVTVVGLEIAPMSLNFGTLDLGQVAAQLVTVTNTGTSPVTISSVKVTTPGNATGDYGSITFCPPLIVRLPATLPAGKSCKIAVGILPTIKIFSPTASTATLTITDSGAASPQVVPLTAQVINPRATLSPSSLTFPAQAVNTTSGAKTVTLTNTGNTPLTIGTLTVSGNFALVNTSGTNCGNGVNVATGSSCAISVTFTPTAKGTRTGSVKITDNALWSPQIISLSGTGK